MITSITRLKDIAERFNHHTEGKLVVLSSVSIIIICYYLLYSIVQGIIHPIPAPGDSWDYHIPIAQSFLNGTFLTIPHPKMFQWYYPGSSEVPLAIFLYLGIPLTLSNILPALILFFLLWKIGKKANFSSSYSLLFALAFLTLNGVIRWMNSISIDLWVAVFFTYLILLLESPSQKTSYFLQLGFASGMLIGSKYTALGLFFILCIVYLTSLRKYFKLKYFLLFSIPFSLFGLFWYIRNYLLTGNPIYNLPIFGLSLPHRNVFTQNILMTILSHPNDMFNAFFSEYKIWIFSLILPPLFLIWKIVTERKVTWDFPTRVIILGILAFFLFLFLPTSNQPWIMVSSFRYSYPVFIPLMLSCFMIAERLRLQVLLGYLVIGSSMVVTSFAYTPKILFLSLPLSLYCIYLLERKSSVKRVKEKK